ncbi:MAG: hypothetical protein ACLP9L_35645 [Thermoguttaceae bacterium]
MPRPASRLTSDREDGPAAKQAWRLAERVPAAGPPGPAWKWLLAVAVVAQAAWIIALVAMATR